MDKSMIHAFSDCGKLRKSKEQDGGQAQLLERFQNLPVHDICYHASFTTINELCQALDSDVDVTNERNMVDEYGMTPCHIVATSTKLCLDMFTLLLDRYPAKILWIRDCHDMSPVDYLQMHRSGRAIPLIKYALQRAIGVWMDGWGLDMWRSDLSHLVDESSITWADDVDTRQAQICEVLDRLESYRQMEATSVVELALWKMVMNNIAHPEGLVPPEERANCRLWCGADVALPNVMECLWEGNGEDVYWI